MKKSGKLVLVGGIMMVILIMLAGFYDKGASNKEVASVSGGVNSGVVENNQADKIVENSVSKEENNDKAKVIPIDPTVAVEIKESISATVKEDVTRDEEWFNVVKVVDGDTLAVNINGVAETIRIIGINTPETVDPRKPVECFGKEASDKAKSILEGKKIRLEADPGQGERDKYDRLLRYIFLEDETDFGKIMIEDGFAYEYTYNTPYKYQAEYKEAEKSARENKRGLWADGVCQEETGPVQKLEPEPAVEPKNCDCSGNVYNCPNFKTHNEAQSCFEYCKQQGKGDIHKLDTDKDNIACESLPDK